MAWLNFELDIVLHRLLVFTQEVGDALNGIVELHLSSEEGFVRTLHNSRQVWVCLLLDEPVELLDTEYLAVDVGLDVVAEITNAESEFVHGLGGL